MSLANDFANWFASYILKENPIRGVRPDEFWQRAKDKAEALCSGNGEHSHVHVHHHFDNPLVIQTETPPDDFRLIHQKLDNIMSAIKEFADKVNAHQDSIDTAISGLTEDVAELKATIEKLQNTPGEVTPEDQVLLDQIEARVGNVATKLAALDALTPPDAPTP